MASKRTIISYINTHLITLTISRAKLPLIMIAMVYYVVLLLVFYTTCACGGLTEFLWSQDEVSGVFKNEDGSLGIKFIGTQSYLQIDTLNKHYFRK